MNTFSSSRSGPITIDSSTEAMVYALTALALGLTIVGGFIGAMFAPMLLTSGMHLFFAIAELAIIFTAPWWMNKSPMNGMLFVAFPVLSGITVTPYILAISVGYANGGAILLNATASTFFLVLAAALFARTTSWNLSLMGRALVFGLIGLLVLSILQIFFSSMQTGAFELLLSGAGIVLFSGFLAYDLQRIQHMSRYGMNPFMMALGLYLDIFNLFLYVLRFMLALSGVRRD